MNPYQNNYATQNQKVLYPVYDQSPIINQIQAPINNYNQIIQQYDSPQLGSMDPIASVNPQIYITDQQQNIRVPSQNQHLDIIQPQNLNQKFNKSRQNQNPTQNNIISYNPVINTNQNIFQGKFNKKIPSNINNIN